MLEEQAIVVDVSNQKVSVETDNKSSCGHCSAKSGCGTSLLSTFFSRNREPLKLETDISLSVGDKVILGVDDSALVTGSVIIYAIPLMMMLVLPIVASYFSASELVSIACGGIGLVVGLIYVKYFSAVAYNSERYRPVILRRID